LPYRLFFFKSNFMVADNVRRLERTMRQAKAAGYNGVVLEDFKFQILDRVESEYYRNLETIRSFAAKLDMDLYPVVAIIGYSNGILTHDPNLAEGLPVIRAPFRVLDGEAALATDPPIHLNGDQLVRVSRFRQYHLSVTVKTRNFISPEAIPAVLTANGRKIAYFDRLPAPSQDWTKHHVVFNSLDRDLLEVRPTGWLKGPGEYSWKDASLQEIGPINVIRREGAPLAVTSVDGKTCYEEGLDFELENHELMPQAGEYEAHHRPLRIRLGAKSRIRDGQSLLVDYYHAVITRKGSVMSCLSAPAVYKLVKDGILGVQNLLQPKGFFLGIDEVQVANWCQSCRQRAMTPGELLAENVRRCVQLVREVSPSAKILVWSDMFDPFHNGHDHYYLLNGDAAGSWEGLDKDVIIANWNFIAIEKSLKWFASRGHTQVVAAYYDRATSEIAEWKRAAAGLPGIRGAMYTTWREDYRHLGSFADLMWNRPS
jgi:hypothetical protein